jgi:nitrogen-specific signal transduction histidine kinase
MSARVPVHVSPAVSETIELLKARLPANIALDVTLNLNDTYVAGDATHLHQVVMNLCNNAVLAMPSGGTLVVELDKEHFAFATTVSEGRVGPGDFVRNRDFARGSGAHFQPVLYDPENGRGDGARSVARRWDCAGVRRRD